MKLKSLILGSAGLFAVTGAQAADLPPAPEPVDYVRVCDAFGSGFFYIPGTDSCLRVRGRLRVEARYRNQRQTGLGVAAPVGAQTSSIDRRSQPDNIGHGVRGGVRNHSPFFMRARGYWGWDHRTNTDIGLVRAFFRGNLTANTTNTASFNPGGARTTGGVVGAVGLDYAFIQIGALTVGYTDLVIEPVFGGYTSEYQFSVAGYGAEGNIAQYEYAFGNGFSIGGVIIDPQTAGLRRVQTNASVGGGIGYGGVRMPDVGAAITYDASWATLRLAGVAHDVRATASSSGHDFGWGIGFSGDIPIGFGTNTSIGFAAQYARGVMNFLHPDNPGGLVGDMVVNAAGGTSLSKGWSISSGIQTQIFDKTTWIIAGGYVDMDQGGSRFVNPDVTWWDIQSDINYELTSNLTLTAAAQYRALRPTGRASSNGFTTMLRAQLDF